MRASNAPDASADGRSGRRLPFILCTACSVAATPRVAARPSPRRFGVSRPAPDEPPCLTHEHGEVPVIRGHPVADLAEPPARASDLAVRQRPTPARPAAAHHGCRERRFALSRVPRVEALVLHENGWPRIRRAARSLAALTAVAVLTTAVGSCDEDASTGPREREVLLGGHFSLTGNWSTLGR